MAMKRCVTATLFAVGLAFAFLLNSAATGGPRSPRAASSIGRGGDASCNISGNIATVSSQLEWCSRDHGFNEGATCGLNALAGAGLTGLPQIVGQAILGNTWDRTNMIGAAKTAFTSGKRSEAIEAAICCQIHNPPSQDCLKNNRQAITDWFIDKTK
jgi:hypothetical protein